jgi:hypothetical protein
MTPYPPTLTTQPPTQNNSESLEPNTLREGPSLTIGSWTTLYSLEVMELFTISL